MKSLIHRSFTRTSGFVERTQMSILWRGVPAVLILYLIAVSTPKLFNISADSLAYILLQVTCFFVLWIYILACMIIDRRHTVLAVTDMRFISLYCSALIIPIVSVLILTIQDGGSLASIAQFVLPIIVLLTLVFGFGRLILGTKDVDKMLHNILIFLMFCSLYNLIVNFESILSISFINNSYDVNFQGFFYNRNIFGYMMAAGVAFAVYLWTLRKKLFYAFSIIALGASLIVSMSRGGIMFLIIFLCLFALFRSRSKLITAITTAVVLFPALIFAVNQPFIESNIIRQDAGDTGRSELRSFGVNYFLQHNILIGDGPKAIEAIEKEYGHSSYHNLYIESLATEGVVGVLIVGIGMGYSYSRIRVVKKTHKQLGAFFQAYLVAYGLYVCFEAVPLFYATPNSLLTTYVLVLFPIFVVNSIRQKNVDISIDRSNS